MTTKTYTEEIDVNVPLRTAYNQWTQFESFPQFMRDVDDVQQVTLTRTHWRTSIDGVKREFDAEIVEQIPDEMIMWQTVNGLDQCGTIRFERLSRNQTHITLHLDFNPQGALEKLGDGLGEVQRHLQRDLEDFKNFIEMNGHETGAWRGKIESGATEASMDEGT